MTLKLLISNMITERKHFVLFEKWMVQDHLEDMVHQVLKVVDAVMNDITKNPITFLFPVKHMISNLLEIKS